MTYIDRIKKLKSEQKITNDRLSEMTGIPLGTLSKILAGISDSPKLANVVAIAAALGTTLDYLVSGTPQNQNNYTLTPDEIAMVEDFRALDGYGRSLTRTVIDKELERVRDLEPVKISATQKKSANSAKILTPKFDLSQSAAIGSKRTVLLYDLPVSAGPGVYLDDEMAEEINIPDNEKTSSADYALRISGNSMEPKYHDGDILLIENTDSVEIGELGIFILDGNGYFKKFGGDCLISLNPEYGDILLKEYAEAVCCGRAIGRLKRK